MRERTPEQRALAARIAAHSKWAVTDPVEGTAAARKAAWDRFEKQADPDGSLPPAERARRAEHLRKAHFQRMALASAKARRARPEHSRGGPLEKDRPTAENPGEKFDPNLTPVQGQLGPRRAATAPSRTKALLTLAVTFPNSTADGPDELEQAAWWCARVWGRREGRAVVGFGHAGHYDNAGMAYQFERFEQRSYDWPGQCERLLDEALAASPEVDVYGSVLLHRPGTSGREKVTAGPGTVAWVDVDGEWTSERQAALDALEVDAWHVESGARGGRHVYVPLGEDVEPDRLEQVNRRLALALGGDHGWDRTKVLRLPGTLNHKPRPSGAPPAPVRWLW